MPTDNKYLFGYVADIISIPVLQDILSEGGGIITSTGLIWPVDMANGDTYYFDINVLSDEIFLLPYLDSDADDAIQITDQNEIIALVTGIQVFVKIISALKKLFQNDNPVMAACLAQNPKHIASFITASLS